jgi:aspartate racemase
MHKVVHYLEEKISIPVLHIAETAALQIQKFEIRKVGLLGTVRVWRELY